MNDAEERCRVEHDKGFLRGLRAGWNFGISTDDAGFQAARESYEKQIAEAESHPKGSE